MTFDVFMEMCLYDPDHGFFSAGAVRPGEKGDFVTSPEISPAFGALLGRWAAMGLPQDAATEWAVVEVGAGSGSLLTQMSEVIEGSVAFHAVERSEAARAQIADALPDVSIATDIDHVVAKNAVVVLNEVLDNVPASLVRRTLGGWDEVTVATADDGLQLVEVPARREVSRWSDEHLGELVVGAIAAVQIRAGYLIERILTRFDGVSMCIIDYGGTTGDLAERTDQNIVRTYRHQRSGFDYLSHPGETDITVDVNTDALSALGRRHGAVVRTMSQTDFLSELGATELIADLQEKEQRLAAVGDVMGQLKARSDALGVSTLLNPRGFGSFKVVTFHREPHGGTASSYT